MNLEILLSPSLDHVTILSEDQKQSIESPIRLDELANTLYQMNNNKTIMMVSPVNSIKCKKKYVFAQ